MGAVYLLKNLIVLEPAMNKLEAAQNVLNELYTMKLRKKQKMLKGVPYMTINRAIRIQKRVVDSVTKESWVSYNPIGKLYTFKKENHENQ